MPRSPWNRTDVIAVIGVFVAIVGIGLAIIQPEVRMFFGFQHTTSASLVLPIPTPNQSPNANPPLKPSGTVFGDFTYGIGGWEIIGNDVSYAQDQGNDALRFNPPDQGPAEAYKNVGSAALSNFREIFLRINLHGATLVTPSNDSNYQTASALYLDQNGWRFVGLYNYIKNSYDGWQNVYVPLTDFIGFDKAASFSRLGFRFWLYKAGTIDINVITFLN